MPTYRTLSEIDKALALRDSDRKHLQATIDRHLSDVERLRTQYAQATTRIDQLLEERGTLTDYTGPPPGGGPDAR